MTKQNFKKVVSLVGGSIVVALVVSISPGNFLVNAAGISRTEAKDLALEYVDDDTAEITKINKDYLDDEDEPYYIVMVETEDDEYELKVYVEDGEVEVVSEEDDDELVLNDDLSVFEDFKEFKDFVTEEDFVAQKDYADFEIEKPTVQAGLNELLRNGKLAAIAEFKETGDKAAFKEAKELIKETKNTAKLAIKEENKATSEEDDDEKVKLTEEQALLFALKEVGVLEDRDDIDDFNEDFDVEDFKITPVKDKNISAYIIEFEYNDNDYTIKVQATTGEILDNEKESIEAVEVEEAEEDDDNKDDEDKVEKVNNGKNKDKVNNGKNK